jgi:hypothetical protein
MDQKRHLDQLKNDTSEMFAELGQNLEHSLSNALTQSCRKSREQFKGVFDYVENDIKRLTANMISDGLIHPALSGLTQNFNAGAASPLSPVLGVLGAGAMGYMSGGQGGAIGSALGFAAGGTLGAELGGIVGSYIDGMKQNKPKVPSFDLLWETVDGQLRNVTNTWANMGMDKEVYKAAEAFAQSQVDFFEKLAVVAGGETPGKFSFSLAGTGASDIAAILAQAEGQSMAASAVGAYPQLEKIFGTGFKEDFKQVFMDTLIPNLGAFTFGENKEVFRNYMDWKFEQFTSMPGEQAQSAFNEWMSGQSIFSPIGRPGIQANSILDLYQSRHPDADYSDPAIFPQLEAFAKTATQGWFNQGDLAFSNDNDVLQGFFTDLNSQVTELFDTVTTGMGAAFTASLKTGEYQTFEDAFKSSILKSTQESLIKGFAEQELIPIIFSPFYGSDGSPGFTEALKLYQEGKTGLDPTIDLLQTMFGNLNTTLSDFQPIWETLNTGFESLGAAIGINTTATENNTEAVMGPVKSFLQSLETGSLAPVQSLAALEDTKAQYYSAAFGNEKDFATYADYMQQIYLPNMKGLSDEYGGLVAGTITDVNNIPWVQAANGAGTTAADIGQKVAEALAPIMIELKDKGAITINLVVNGQTLQTAIIDSLNDPSTMQAIRAKI